MGTVVMICFTGVAHISQYQYTNFGRDDMCSNLLMDSKIKPAFCTSSFNSSVYVMFVSQYNEYISFR